MTCIHALLIEDDRSLRDLLCEELESEGLTVHMAGTLEEAGRLLQDQTPDLVISDLRLPDGDGMSLLPLLLGLEQRPAILLITAFGTVRQAVEALRAGADDFLTKPIDFDHLQLTIQRLLKQRRLQDELTQYRNLLGEDSFHGMVGDSRPMRSLFDQIRRVAGAQGPVLVLGESGTGKELVARAVHRESPRSEGPFLAINCGGIPSELMESEFFGHSAGAFTGARRARAGLFQEAHGGTLLLDEIGEMPLALQAKLLRVLQDGRLRPVGSDEELAVDVRIIAATHRDLVQAVADGEFREDLYYRLETFALQVPPLRNRGDDWMKLARLLLTRLQKPDAQRVRGFSEAALTLLNQYDWPGNVRELNNVVERAVTFCDGSLIQPEHLPARLREAATSLTTAETSHGETPDTRTPDQEWPTLEDLQTRYVSKVLEHTEGNKQRAARILGVTRRTLYRWLEQQAGQE